MICRDCARGTPSRLYQVDTKSFALAIPATLAVALFGGWLMATIGHFGFFGAFAGLLYGMGVGEVALRITGRKRGLVMEIMAGSCVFAGLLGGYALHFLTLMPPSSYASPPGESPMPVSFLIARLLLDPWIYVTIGISIFGAVSRVRSIN